MPKYIDADVLEKEGWTLHRTYPQDSNTMVYEIKKPSEFPTVDVVERKVGKWENCPIADGFLQCSVCGSIRLEASYFCPNCGAEMRKETEDAEIH